MSQSRVPQVIEAFAAGKIVVVTDDDDRENEGDLILAAVHATPEKMAFIIRNTCGIVCAPLTGEIARRLHLAPMVADSDAIHGTAFTISVDYRHSTTTGISAEERTATIRALANGNAGSYDLRADISAGQYFLKLADRRIRDNLVALWNNDDAAATQAADAALERQC